MPIMLGTSRIDAEVTFGTLECEQLASQDCVFFMRPWRMAWQIL